jgi:hypothetical protein
MYVFEVVVKRQKLKWFYIIDMRIYCGTTLNSTQLNSTQLNSTYGIGSIFGGMAFLVGTS